MIDPKSPQNFEEVFSAELEEIALRQNKANGNPVDRKELAGLALSGGGIRSATSSLGVLQALRKIGMLSAFDYLSTVSGGGFTGSWWSAWTSREFDNAATADDKFFPPSERTQPERDAEQRAIPPEESEAASPADATRRRKSADPVHHLRLFSNYLTPVKGLLSGDTWRAITIVSRNLLLTWLVLVPILFAAVLVSQSYFVAQPNSEKEFLYPYSHEQEDQVLNFKLQAEMRQARHLDTLVHRDISHPLFHSLLPGSGEARSNSLLAIGKDVDSIMQDELADSAIAADAGKRGTYASLKSEVDSVRKVVVALHEVNDAGPQKPALDLALDKNVDTVMSKLDELHQALVHHRWQVRDGWLFNDTHITYLTNRLIYASYVPIALIAWIIMFIVLWMLNVSNTSVGGSVLQGTLAFLIGLVSFSGMLYLFPAICGRELQMSMEVLVASSLAWQLIALVLLHRVIWDEAHRYWKSHRRRPRAEIQSEIIRLLEVRRARIVQSHERLLLGTFMVTVFLMFGGFGHELINYMTFYTSHSSDLVQWFTRGASVLAIVSAITGATFAAGGSLPAAGGDHREYRKPSKLKSFFIALAPPLILVILLCSISWLGHYVLQHVAFRAEDKGNSYFMMLILMSLGLGAAALYYAGDELRFVRGGRIVRFALYASIVIISVGFWLLLRHEVFNPAFVWAAVGLNAGAWLVIYWRSRSKNQVRARRGGLTPEGVSRAEARSAAPMQDPPRRAVPRREMGRMLGATFVILVGSQAIVVGASIVLSRAEMPFHWPFLAGLAACLVMLIYELILGKEGNHESRVLIGGVALMLTLFLFIPTISEDPHWGILHVLAILVSVAVGLVVFIGWRIDPNALSIHSFYRSRLVRTYLGASNWLRGHSGISDVHRNDDLLLTDLQNCENGVPYHLVNTTLNLLGSKSLEEAQRHSSNFILSKRFCGSVTTGYRPTEQYMSGEMTLGTAAAISGAAASPNMGSNSISGAMTVLMSLLNIRLGYWAPNPMRSRWCEAQPRLWPYYLIKESFSQTTGLGAFCYLTDGGHFDNSGLYPLIERACRFIVIADNGADPMTHFNDIGSAFRRCRIDFGSEFSMDGLKDMTSLGTGDTRSHWLRGTVTYCDEHLSRVWGDNWAEGLSSAEKEAYHTGTILILKPVLLGDEPADVLQYGLKNPEFPQQSTANQWFSEDQFESYRRLGYWTAQTAFGMKTLDHLSRGEQLEAIRTAAAGSI